jgi:prepilin-type N-terminal cleavage/methylation domain-containing protein
MLLRASINGAGRHCAQRGFSLFELVVVVLLIGVLMSLAMDRLMRMQVDAERVSVQYVIGALDSAINLQVADIVVRQGLGAIRSLEKQNPMTYLSKTPANYTGIVVDDATDWQRASGWYFDSDKKILVYTVKNTDYFQSSVNGRPRIRLQLRLIYQSDGENRSIRGIKLQSLDEYRWLLEEK